MLPYTCKTFIYIYILFKCNYESDDESSGTEANYHYNCNYKHINRQTIYRLMITVENNQLKSLEFSKIVQAIFHL